MIKYGRWLLATFITLFGFSPVFAASFSASMGVSASVTPGCSALSTTSLSFGTVPAGNLTKDSTSTITVTCALSVPYNITISDGQNPNFFSIPVQRRMASGGNLINYELFTDAARTCKWHDGNFFSCRLDAVGNGAAQIQTVFGRV